MGHYWKLWFSGPWSENQDFQILRGGTKIWSVSLLGVIFYLIIGFGGHSLWGYGLWEVKYSKKKDFLGPIQATLFDGPKTAQSRLKMGQIDNVCSQKSQKKLLPTFLVLGYCFWHQNLPIRQVWTRLQQDQNQWNQINGNSNVQIGTVP